MEKKLLYSQATYLTSSYLVSLFDSHKAPKQKINDLIHKGELLRVKQGLYLLGPDYQRSYSKEVLAGMIYGPSAISLEYALSFHNLIPERVEAVTSICFKRDKSFKTAVGDFTYRYISDKRYSIGIEHHQTPLGNFLMASPEKALCDLVLFQKLESETEALTYCLENLRIDPTGLMKLNTKKLIELSSVYRKKSVQNLIDAIFLYQNNKMKKELVHE
jgi:hypothetical protein